MRRIQPLAAANSLLLALLFSSSPLHKLGANAHPYPLQNTNGENHDAGLRYLLPRQCVQRCGIDGQYCCDSNTECFTSANIAGCSARGGGDAWGIFTTTWTETNTFTSTVTTHFPEPTDKGGDDSGVDCVPDTSRGETACGKICCADFQQCSDGWCVQRDGWGGGGGGGGLTTITQGGETITTRFSAPYRPTGATFTGDSSATTTTTTAATGTAIGSDGDDGDDSDSGTGTGGGLSGGEIAGIVIGVLAGLFILGMICFCCIARGLWGLCCGSRKKDDRRERVEVEETYYRGGSRAPSAAAAAHARRDRHSGWFGRPRSAGSRRDEKDRSGGAKWLGLGAAAATLLALLHLRKDKKPEQRRPHSRYTDSYYSYSDFSNSSQGGRSHPPRRSERAESRYSRR